MPELPEVEVISRGLNTTLPGRTIVSVEHVDLTRLSEPAETLLPKVVGRTIKRAYRRAKILLIEMTDDLTLVFHLKMTGRVVHGPMREPDKHDRIFFRLDDESLLSFADMRKFGFVKAMTPAELDSWEFFARCGPEPLENTPEMLAERVRNRKSAIKGVLLNQGVVVGVGNIYADEALFRAGIHPATRADRISKQRAVKLFAELQAVLKQAIAENGSSIRNYVNADGDAGAFQNNFHVYGKADDNCSICQTPLAAMKVAGRTSTFCPMCQKKR